MELRHLFATLSLAIVAGAGVAAGVSSGNEAGLQKAEATVTGKVYVSWGSFYQSTKGYAVYCYIKENDVVTEEDWFELTAENTVADEYHLYSVSLSKTYTGLVFCRMNSVETLNWDNKDVQTFDFTDASKNLVVVGEWENDYGKHSYKASVYNVINVNVLDLYGNSFNDGGYVYAYDSSDSDYNYGVGWRGVALQRVRNESNIYYANLLGWQKTLIFNNSSNYQTDNLSITSGCYILSGFDNVQSGVTYQVADYIDRYMKFETVNDLEDKGTGKCLSEGWYLAAKSAYEEESFATYRAELCQLSYVVNRLNAWAAAYNHGSFAQNQSGDYVFGSIAPMMESVQNNDAIYIAFAAVSLIMAVSLGGYFFIRRKHQ